MLSVSWPVRPLSRDAYNELRKMVQRDNNYWIDTPGKLTTDYEHLTVKYPEYTNRIIFNIRNTLIKDKIVKTHWKITSRKDDILPLYGKVSICDLSTRFDYPPRCLLRAIFKWREIASNSIIDAVFNNDESAIAKLHKYDQEQLALANECDADRDPSAATKNASVGEKAFLETFSLIDHKTEEQIRLLQIDEDSRVIATPDILFDKPILINGCFVHWIDYKNYVGTPDTFLSGKLRAQAKKYTERFGPGAFAFKGGFVEGSDLCALLLSTETNPFLDAEFRQRCKTKKGSEEENSSENPLKEVGKEKDKIPNKDAEDEAQ